MPSAERLNSPSSWYVVCTEGGSVAVVHFEDLEYIFGAGLVSFAMRVSFEEGACCESSQASDMSANHRIKAGESGGVG